MRATLLACALVLAPSFASASTLCPAALAIHANGSATFDGVQYANSVALEAHLTGYRTSHGNCVPKLLVDPGTAMQTVIAFSLISGVRKIGFLAQPLARAPAH